MTLRTSTYDRRMEPVRWGILSTASINSAVIPPLQASPESVVVAIASREQARADASAAEWGIPRAYGTYDALIDDPDVEAVYISLPAALHVEWSIRALEAGKHVLCEKPFTRDPAAAARAFDAADAAGRLLMEAFMYRHHPQTQRLADLLAAGAVGKVRLIRATFCVPLPAGVVQMSPELDGGSLLDVGCYCVSGSRLAGGEPTSVTAHQIVGPSGVDVRLAGTLVFPRRRRRADRLRVRSAAAAEPRDRRRRGIAPRREPVELRAPRDRGAARERDGTHRDRGRRPLPAPVRQFQPRGQGARGAAAGPR